MRKRFTLFALALLITPAGAQVQQSGAVTPNHLTMWVAPGVVGDAGTAAAGGPSSFGVTASGPALCQNSGPNSGPYNQLCFAPTVTGGGFTFTSYGGATGTPTFNVNGTVYTFPFTTSGIVGPGSTTSGDLVCWNNLVGTLVKDCGSTLPSGLTIPSPTLTGTLTAADSGTWGASGIATGVINATTGFKANGTSGVSQTCTVNQAKTLIFSEGILTGGTCNS